MLQSTDDIGNRLSDLFFANRKVIEENSAGVLNEKRDAAIEAFMRQGIPGAKSENYKYTDLSGIFSSESYRRVFAYEKAEVDLYDVFSCDVPELDTHLVLLINGWYYARNQRLNGLPDKVLVKSMKQAAIENKDLLDRYYGNIANPEKDAIVALNTAFSQDGIFVYVPDNVLVDKPIQVVNLLSGDDSLYATQRNLFVTGKNSHVKLLFCDHTIAPHNFIVNNLSEAVVDKDSLLEIYTIQNQHNNTISFNGLFVSQERDSEFLSNTVTLHGGVVRNSLSVLLDGEHAKTNAYGLSLTDREQHVDSFTFIKHNRPDCRSNQLYKSILDDVSSGAFTGRIHVVEKAQKTEAFQRNNSVLLTKSARMNTKPQLVIDNDDVKCSHGATVGRIDNNALFYLKSRGISEQEARLMLMFAFAHEVLQAINVPPLRECIDHLVDKRLRGEVLECHSCAIRCDR